MGLSRCGSSRPRCFEGIRESLLRGTSAFGPTWRWVVLDDGDEGFCCDGERRAGDVWREGQEAAQPPVARVRCLVVK